MISFSKVLVPVDFSEWSRRALGICSTIFAGNEPMEFHFVFVLRPPSDYAPMAQGATREMRAKLTEFVSEFSHEGEHTVHVEILTGQPAMALCNYARDQGCDLIAIATHGRTGIAHLLIGSTAEQVVRHAPCPVLSLRPA